MANQHMITFTSHSSSSSYSTSLVNPKKHDVFLSFRGEDTRKNFTSHLYYALLQRKVETYIDNLLEKGDEIGPELIKAIEESYVSVVIFSENYANSKWCLDEINKIMECKKDLGQIVIPVFYNIDPSHVRRQSGSYEQAFAKHEQDLKHNKNKVLKWKTALTEAANLAGWDISQTDSTEAGLIKQIVEDVLTRLKQIYVGKNNNSKVLVGIHEQVALLESFVALESDAVRAIGIWGMGGIGKTTLARQIFAKLQFEYEASCFMENVRENLQKYGVTRLQNGILCKLLEENDPSIGIPIVVCQYNLIRLRGKKILLVLDDVDDLKILISLCGRLDWFGKGSRVIVTSRDKQVLTNLANDIYEVKALQSEYSLKLFSLHAFKENYPKEEWMDLSVKAVNYTKGVPLAIEVLGSFLYGKEKGVWESQLEKLKKMTLPEIQRVLRLSYNGLDREEQDIFLYLACFFSQKEYGQDVSILDDCGYSVKVGLTKLCDKALISFHASDFWNWTMHDLIREMGKEIVCEEFRDPGKRRHLWDPQDVYQVLENATGTGAIESLRLDMRSESRDLCLSPKAFHRMFNLKFLKLRTNDDCMSFKAKLIAPKDSISLPKGLRILVWEGCSLKSLGTSFCAENLVELDISYSNLERLWNGVQNLVKLKRIYLHHCAQLVELPDLSKALNIEYVDLSWCNGLSNLHPSILSLPNLKDLLLYECENLISFRSDHQFKYLQYINLRGCTSLKEFSVMSESMEELSLCGTNIVEANSLGLPLNKLEYWNCGFSQRLPHNFLQQLNLSELRKFTLDLFDMRYNSKSLHTLYLCDTNIESLPTSINQLSMLRGLDLSNCKRLRCIPPLHPNIDVLNVEGCVSLEGVSISTLGRCFCYAGGYFAFLNCWRLNEKALNTIMSFAHVRINEAAYIQHLQPHDHENDENTFVVDLPGRKVPADSYEYWTTTELTMSIQLSNLSNLIGLSFCVVYSSTQYETFLKGSFRFSCSFLTSGGQKEHTTVLFPGEGNLDPDHVLLWYNERFSKRIIDEIKERSIDNQCTTYDPELSFKIQQPQRGPKIKEWGVHPIYSSDLFSFSVPLASEAKTKRKRVTEELLDMDPPPKKKLKTE